MAQAMAAASGAYSIIPLLQVMMVPSDHATEVAPDVGVSGVNAFFLSIWTSSNYVIRADPAPVLVGTYTYSDIASSATGMYMSLPQESHESQWHMGFVPAGATFALASLPYATVPPTDLLRGFDIRPHYFGAWQQNLIQTTTTATNAFQFTYESELALPRLGSDSAIAYQPPLPANLSKVRAFASDFKISSTTLSGINFNLTGVFHSGVITDTRYIAQMAIEANAPRRAYPPSALSQQSVTRPDDLVNAPLVGGAIDLMGPDYPRQWCSVDVDATDTLESEWRSFQYSTGDSTKPIVPLQDYSVTRLYGAYNVAQLWITPWDTNFYISNRSTSSGPPTNHQRILYGAINEDGVLDVDIDVKASVASERVGSTGDTVIYQYAANFIHVFAYIGSDGLVRYNLRSSTDMVDLTDRHTMIALALTNNGAPGFAVPTDTTQVPWQAPRTLSSRPRMLRSGMANTTGGKYLGTLCTLSLMVENHNITTAQWAVYAYPCEVRVRARNVDAPGRVGPAHIIRYDNVGVGQQITFAGTQWLQCVAQGNLMPFIQTNGQQLTVPDNIFSKFVDLLWATSPLYRRILSLAEYDRVIKPYFRELTLRELEGSIQKFDDWTATRVHSLGAAGGFFDPSGRGSSSSDVVTAIMNGMPPWSGNGAKRRGRLFDG